MPGHGAPVHDDACVNAHGLGRNARRHGLSGTRPAGRAFVLTGDGAVRTDGHSRARPSRAVHDGWRRLGPASLGLAGLLVFLGLWELVPRLGLVNPMMLPGMDQSSACGGYYHHQLVRTAEGWKSRHLVEENRWFLNPPSF